MSPYEQVAALYEKYPQPSNLTEDIVYYGKYGHVIIHPDFMVMGIRRDNAWFIQAIAGDLAKAWEALPYDLPYIAFYRPRTNANDLRFYPLARLRSLCKPHASFPA